MYIEGVCVHCRGVCTLEGCVYIVGVCVHWRGVCTLKGCVYIVGVCVHWRGVCTLEGCVYIGGVCVRVCIEGCYCHINANKSSRVKLNANNGLIILLISFCCPICIHRVTDLHTLSRAKFWTF